MARGRGVRKESWFRSSLNYISESRNYVYAIALIFLTSALIGFAFSASLTFLDPLLEEIFNEARGLDAKGLVWFIFQNNVISSFWGLFLGVFFGLVSLLNSFVNGIVVGYVLAKASSVAGFSVILGLVPHGIFELPAIFISLGLGLKLGMSFFEKGRVKVTLVNRLRNSFKVFVTIVIPLLIIAAIIEGLLISFV